MDNGRYRLWVNSDRTIMVHLWPPTNDQPELLTIAFRDHPAQTWGPPITLREDK